MKSFLRFSLLLIFLASIDMLVIAQLPNDYILKVNQFGQFVKRFNYEEDFSGNEITASFSKKINRFEYIALLFDKNDKRTDSLSPYFSKDYMSLKNEFIKEVVDKSLKINRISDTLFCIAICDVNYQGKVQTIKLVLKQHRINGGIAWVIYDVYADFIYNDDSNHPDSLRFIPPTSNEVNYIHLKQIFEKKDSFSTYAFPGYECNRLSIFFHLLHNGNIEYKHVKSSVYLVSDIPGWIIQVREFKRSGNNSGWLVESISKNNKPVNEYLKLIMNNNLVK